SPSWAHSRTAPVAEGEGERPREPNCPRASIGTSIARRRSLSGSGLVRSLALPEEKSRSSCRKNRRNFFVRGRIVSSRIGTGMAHSHEKIDFTVAIFVVHEGRVLLVHHRKLNKWLPLGGHIELEEDPEQAALREAREESGFDIELIGERPPTTEPGTRALIAP